MSILACLDWGYVNIYLLLISLSLPLPPSPSSLPPSLQTNVYATAQNRKMGYFKGFIRKAICVIPPHHELRKRTARRPDDMGSPIPTEALNAMKCGLVLLVGGARKVRGGHGVIILTEAM